MTPLVLMNWFSTAPWNLLNSKVNHNSLFLIPLWHPNNQYCNLDEMHTVPSIRLSVLLHTMERVSKSPSIKSAWLDQFRLTNKSNPINILRSALWLVTHDTILLLLGVPSSILASVASNFLCCVLQPIFLRILIVH